MGKKLGEGLSDIDKEALRALLLKDGEVYKYAGSQEILSDADIKTLMDRYAFPRLGIPATGRVADFLSAGAMLRTSKQRGAMAMRTSSRSSRQGRMGSRRRRVARRVLRMALGNFAWLVFLALEIILVLDTMLLLPNRVGALSIICTFYTLSPMQSRRTGNGKGIPSWYSFSHYHSWSPVGFEDKSDGLTSRIS